MTCASQAEVAAAAAVCAFAAEGLLQKDPSVQAPGPIDGGCLLVSPVTAENMPSDKHPVQFYQKASRDARCVKHV